MYIYIYIYNILAKQARGCLASARLASPRAEFVPSAKSDRPRGRGHLECIKIYIYICICIYIYI